MRGVPTTAAAAAAPPLPPLSPAGLLHICPLSFSFWPLLWSVIVHAARARYPCLGAPDLCGIKRVMGPRGLARYKVAFLVKYKGFI